MLYTENFELCHFFVFSVARLLTPTVDFVRYSIRSQADFAKNLISSIKSDTLRESSSIKLVLNNTNFILHVR